MLGQVIARYLEYPFLTPICAAGVVWAFSLAKPGATAAATLSGIIAAHVLKTIAENMALAHATLPSAEVTPEAHDKVLKYGYIVGFAVPCVVLLVGTLVGRYFDKNYDHFIPVGVTLAVIAVWQVVIGISL